MAFELKKIFFIHAIGETEVNCYAKINKIYGDKNTIFIDVAFKNKAHITGCIYSFSCSFSPDMNGDNFIKQAYNHLKTLPEFSGAIDC